MKGGVKAAGVWTTPLSTPVYMYYINTIYFAVGQSQPTRTATLGIAIPIQQPN